MRAHLGWGHRGFRVPRQRSAWLALVLLLLLPGLVDVGAFVERMSNPDHLPDLKVWLPIADEFLSRGTDAPLYPERGWYIYPPLFLTLIQPLNWMPLPMAAIVFEVCKWLAVLVSLRCAWDLCSPADEDVPPIVALGSLLLAGRFIWNDMGQGNVNCFIMAGMLVGGWLLVRGRAVPAGFVVGLVTCIKVTPALVLVYFAYKRQWRALLGAVMAAVVGLFLWPAMWFGWSENLALLAEWYHLVIDSFLRKAAVDSLQTNQSLAGLINRLFTSTPALRDPEVFITISVLSADTLRVIRGGLALGIVALLAWSCRGRLSSMSGAGSADESRSDEAPRYGPLAFAAELGMVFMTMLVLSGISWKAHFVTLLLPFAVMLSFLADARSPRSGRAAVGAALAVSGGLTLLTTELITPRGADYAEAWGLVLLAGVAAAVGCGLVRGKLRRFT